MTENSSHIAGQNAIQLAGLGHAYHPGRWVFRGYSANIARGKVFAILGPNGRGKSTLLHILLRTLVPSRGHVSVTGSTAFVPQLFQVSFDYTVLDMVLMGRARQIGLFSRPSQEDESLSLRALARFGLAGAAGRPFHELSGGQRQLAIISRALVAQSEILILDEPTSSLDLGNQSLVLEWMSRLAQEDGLTIVFTTHHPHHAAAIADEALLMFGEDEYACGPANSVLTEANLSRLYSVPLRRITFDHESLTVEALVPVLQPRTHKCPPCRPPS